MQTKSTLIFLLVSSVYIGNTYSADDGLPEKYKDAAVDCGVQTETNLDRTLEKSSLEGTINSNSDDTKEQKVTFGIAGSTATTGAKLTDEYLQALVIGKTKYQEIVSNFGKPTTVLRTDQLFMAKYEFSKFESKRDATQFIPIIGSLFAKGSTKNQIRKVDLRFQPDTGILISCKKTDTETGGT
ncbi:MAG: hypothetical protein ORN50_00465, partial [Crocinitomicaceae bacterium]|nr:hypothetical protein [Crocinitomicaceae bacterium]